MKEKGSYRIPLRNTAYLLYHLAKSDVYDPDVFARFEKEVRTVASNKMTSRHAMGALYGYYRSNQGTMYGLEFWEENMTNNLEDLRTL